MSRVTLSGFKPRHLGRGPYDACGAANILLSEGYADHSSPQNVNVDVAAKHPVLGDRGTLTLRVADVFNTLRYDFTLTGPGLLTDSRFKRESRMAFLSFAYRFGQNQTSRSPRKSEVDEAGGALSR